MSEFECPSCGLPFSCKVDERGREVDPYPTVWRDEQPFCSQQCADDNRLERILGWHDLPRNEEDRRKIIKDYRGEPWV